MASMSGLRHRSYGNIQDKKEKELFVFGYSCKLFRDDEKATMVDHGKFLIPWMGDDKLMIDRYDARGHLHDLKPFEPTQDVYSLDDLPEEEREIERQCDEERYLALHKDLTEEQMYHEEELKRLRTALAVDGAYHEIGFTYETAENENDGDKLPSDIKVDEPDDEPYQIPPGLEIPKGIEVPSNMKIHAIIQKTALFISQQGGQMEVLIKINQSANPQFAFMHLENPLYPYYKHLVKEIKAGKYKPPETKKPVGETDEDDDDDDHYLHPSLMSGKPDLVPEFTVPSINFRRSSDDSYSILVRNLKSRIVVEDSSSSSPRVNANQDQRNADSPNTTEEEKHAYSHPLSSEVESRRAQPPPPGEEMGMIDDDDKHSASSSSSSSITDSPLTESSGDELQENPKSKVVYPPPGIQKIIDKMVTFVAKNGEDFEIIVKDKNDKRFEFMHPCHEYYQYYVQKKETEIARLSAHKKLPPMAELEMPVQPAVINDQVNPEENPEPKADDYVESSVTVEGEVKASDLEVENNSQVLVSEQIVTKIEVDETSQCDSPTVPEAVSIPQEMPVMEEEKIKEIKPVKVAPRVVKGPISFSLKSKDGDNNNLEKKKKRSLLLDDSDGEDENVCAEKKAKAEPIKMRRKSDDLHSAHTTTKEAHLSETDEKPKKQYLEEIEAKIAEDRLKDKLASAAREKLTQQKREKQLQLERKRRLNIFFKLKNNAAENSSETAVENSSSEVNETRNREKQSRISAVEDSPKSKDYNKNVSPSISEITSPKNGAFHSSEKNYSAPASPTPALIDNKWSSPSPSSSTGSSDEQDNAINLKEPAQLEKKRSKHKVKKRRKHLHSSKEDSHKSHRTSHTKSRHHSRSPSRHRSHKGSGSRSSRHKRSRSGSKRTKALPAAYAFGRRSRSRSRSPRRHKASSRLSPTHRSKKRP